jgi:hypothetical protein
VERGWLRQIQFGEVPEDAITPSQWETLGLVEVTPAGRHELARRLGLDTRVATHQHGLIGGGQGQAGRRRRLLRTLARTIGTNGVFVALAGRVAGK